MRKNHEKLIEQYQCPGCVCGSKPKGCPSYKPKSISWAGAEGVTCEGHVIGTRMGLIPFALGLPKGFCRPGVDPVTREPVTKMLIRLWPFGQVPRWDKFNVPVWGMEYGGAVFVRTYMPRNNLTAVDVLESASIKQVKPIHDVVEFVDEMD